MYFKTANALHYKVQILKLMIRNSANSKRFKGSTREVNYNKNYCS